ncbi:MerR family transcriptional regulator [Ancylobacter sp. VKM B-3255]|uniref:MerR family transcriptional regulator n=1 Tax=Ancylobacter radicis TaxID=2836179 RepID=A0ABS5R470_9HYPH|nr:MerR family transcriptional regulator [Ancylobacter radicis]
MEKGPDAFRTISEVADDLDLPQHVLRFWETRFPQIRPLKRGGGRRYYRPDDVELLRGIRHLLYSEGYTIRGVQRILKEEGPRYVQAIWRDAEADALAVAELEEMERHAPSREPVDAGHPGRGREVEGGRGGPLSGLLNLLPSRQRDAAPREPVMREPAYREPVARGVPPEEAPAPRRGARRRPESEPDFLELPLLPDLAPQSRPPRGEAPAREPELPPVEPRRAEPVLRPIEPRVAEPRMAEPRMAEPRPQEPRLHEARPAELRAGEGRASFPFRAVAPEPEPDEIDPFAPLPEPARPAHILARQNARPMPVATPVRPVEELPVRAPERVPERAIERAAEPSPQLSRDDVQRLQAALYELQECRRLLDAARG